jgi:ABC-type antimicrobial peptide transport system permease subunit
MGFLRLLKQSIIFGTRSRRLFIFIFIFAILTGVTLFAMDSIFQENSTELLSSRSIVLQTFDLSNKTENLAIADGYADNMVDREGDYYLVRYTQVIPDVYLFSLNSNPWLNPEVQPNDIKEGSYVTNFDKSDDTYQIIASTGSESTFSSNSTIGYEITQDLEIGNKLDLNFNTEFQLSLEVVGLFNKTSNINEGEERLWIFVPDSGFDEIMSSLYPGDSTARDAKIQVSHVVLTASGSTEFFFGILNGNANDNLERIEERVSNNNGGFTLRETVATSEIRAASTQKDIFLLFGGIGSTIVATMYAFIIARFRTREIATLKAVGYTARQVRVVLLAEIGTVSLIGYIISTFVIQVLLTLNSQATLGSTYVPDIWIFWNIITDPLGFGWFPSITAIFTFALVVLSNVIGFFIISKRTVAVRPVELFRADA